MKDEEITVESIEELIELIENIPDGCVLEIDLGEDGDKGG